MPQARARRLIGMTDGAKFVQMLALSGIATVLAIRAYLGLTGYPRIGGGSLHFAHVLWGGLLMLAAILGTLLYSGAAARAVTAIVGGVGLGLFVDEVGKFVTNDNDYFFRPAAGIIYACFALLLVWASWLRRRPPADPDVRLATAARLAAAGVVTGMTVRERDAALRLIDGHRTEAAEAVRLMLSAAPIRRPSARLDRARAAIERLVRRSFARRQFTPIVLWAFAGAQLITAIIFTADAITVANHQGPVVPAGPAVVIACALTRVFSLALVVVAVWRWRTDTLAAYRWFRLSALVGLLITQVFNFTGSQFRAVAELPFDLLVLALLTFQLRRGTDGVDTVKAGH